MELEDSDIIENTLALIISIVVQVKGRRVILGNLIEKDQTRHYKTNQEAEEAAERYRIKARNYYEPRIRANIDEFKEFIRQQG